jgi:RNA polymerase sigma-70 factor (ECF subfamily)
VSQATQDDALLERLRSGDNAAFRDLIVRYNQRLLIVARAIIGDVFAEDVVQEAWTSIFRAINRFEGRSTLSTWMIQIVSNEAKSRLRKEKRHMNVADTEQLPAALAENRFAVDGHWQIPPAHWELGSPERLLEEDQLRCCIEHTLTLLPENQKAVFMLRDLEQMPLSDIAAQLLLSESNVRVLLHRARFKLLDVVDHFQETGEC